MSVRETLRNVGYSVLRHLPRRSGRGDRLILAYHNVVPSGTGSVGENQLHLPFDKFVRQLAAVKSEADIVPLMDILTRAAPAERRVAITFDDAYESALSLAVRHCVSIDVPSTIFVAPALLGRVPAWDRRAEAGTWSSEERARFLNTDHGLEDLATDPDFGDTKFSLLRIGSEAGLHYATESSAVQLGNHTMRHANLSAVSPEVAAREVLDAQAWLSEKFPKALLPVVAYPYGLRPPDPSTLLLRTGLKAGLSVTGGWMRSGRLVHESDVPRWNVPASMPIDGFRFRMRGWASS